MKGLGANDNDRGGAVDPHCLFTRGGIQALTSITIGHLVTASPCPAGGEPVTGPVNKNLHVGAPAIDSQSDSGHPTAT
jgi:hypothetical protein